MTTATIPAPTMPAPDPSKVFILRGDGLTTVAKELQRETNDPASFLQYFYGWELHNCPEAKKHQVFIAGVTSEGKEVAVTTDSWSWIANGRLPQDECIDGDELATVWKRYLAKFPPYKYIVTARPSDDSEKLLSWERFYTKKDLQKHITQLKKQPGAAIIRAYTIKTYACDDPRRFFTEYTRISPRKWAKVW